MVDIRAVRTSNRLNATSNGMPYSIGSGQETGIAI